MNIDVPLISKRQQWISPKTFFDRQQTVPEYSPEKKLFVCVNPDCPLYIENVQLENSCRHKGFLQRSCFPTPRRVCPAKQRCFCPHDEEKKVGAPEELSGGGKNPPRRRIPEFSQRDPSRWYRPPGCPRANYKMEPRLLLGAKHILRGKSTTEKKERVILHSGNTPIIKNNTARFLRR